MIQPIAEKIARWVFFNLIIAASPFLLSLLLTWFRKQPVSAYDVIDHGELLIVAVAIAAEAVGDLTESGRKFVLTRIGAFGVGIFVLITGSGLFYGIQSAASPPDPERVAYASLLVFVTACFAGAACKTLAEADRILTERDRVRDERRAVLNRIDETRGTEDTP